MTAEDFLNQYDPSNKEVASQEPASSAKSFLDQYDPSINLKPSGTSFGEEVSQLGSAFVESIGRPLENMGESFESFGFSGVANALKGAITEPENYVSAGQRFMEPAPDEAQLMGFAWQYAPRAAVEQVGQVIGAIGTRAVGAGVGGVVAGPPGAIAGGFLGPAVFGAAQVIGPVAKERAMNNGREVPNNSDLVAATLTAIGSGSLDAIGAQFLPGGRKAAPKFFKRVASAFVGEGLLTEAPQSVIEQIGSTAGTEKGLNINVKQAVGEGLIGGTSAAGLTAIVSPFSKPAEKQVIRTPEEAEELDINAKANQEAVLLMGDPADQTQNERVTKLKEIESVIANNETLMTGLEPNAPERSKLDLENRVAKKEAEKLKAEITQGAGLSVTITEAERQQIELARAITAPKPLPTDVLPTETPSATYGREEQVYDVFGGITRKPVSIPKPAELPAAPTIEEQTAERTYGGETGVFDVFAGARRKPVVTEEPPVSMVGKEVIPGVTPESIKPTIKESLTVAPEAPAITPAPVAETPAVTPTAEVAPAISDEERFNSIKSTPPSKRTQNDIDWANQYSKAKSQIEAQKEAAAIAEERANVDEFLNELSPMAKSKANAALNETMQRDNKILTRRKIIEDSIDNGYSVELDTKGNRGGKRILVSPTGTFIEEKRLTKTALDYAEFLISKKRQQETTTPVAETPAVTEAPAAEVAPAIEPLTDDQAETIRDIITLRKSQGREPNPEQVKRLAEYDARKAGVDVQEGDIVSNIVVGHPMFEAPQPELSNLVPIKVQNKEQLASPIQRTQQVRDAAQSYIGQYQVEQAKAKTPAQKKAFAKKFSQPELSRQREILDYIKNDVEPELDRLEKSAPSPTPAVSEPITPAEPAGIARKRKGEAGGVLIPSREDFIQAGQNIYEKGMEFGAWAKQMIQQFGDVVREFLGDVWQAVSGMPAKLNEVMGYLPKKGEAGVVNIGGGKQPAKKPTPEQPTPKPEKPTEPVIEKATGKPEKIVGEEVGPPKKTPEGIIAKTQELLRKQFNPSKVTEKNTTEAFRALGRLIGRGGTDFAKELNDIGRVVDESGAASEISMGAALFINDLFEYSIRLAAEGNKKMLGIMLTNINKLPTAGIGASDAARDLRARLELAQRFRTMGDAEQDAFINYTAEFIYGPNPTKDQIQSIKIGYDAVEKVQEPTAEEVEEEIAAVGKKTGTDLVGKINDEFTKATEKGKEKRKTEEVELDEEYKKVQKQADAEIEKLAKIQSDTPSFDPAAARQTANYVRAIVANDLKQRPDMGRKAPWKSMLVSKLQEAGVEVAAAETLADIVWRQHEINSLSRELSSINKAIEKGPISEIVKAIKETPLEEQQKPNWRYEVMRDYLRKAGLPLAQAERIAKLMDISLQKRFTQAKEQAFTDAISKTAPWKEGNTRSKRAFKQVLEAIRAGALDPSRNMASDIAALNGWTGFTADQYKNLLKNDTILADPKSGELQKAEAYKAIQDIISKSKLPIRARDVIGQYYDAQALNGIPTLTVNAFSPIAFAMRNAIVEATSGTIKGDAKAIGRAATAFVDSIKSWANTVAFSFKNNVTVYSNVDYIVNDDNLLRLYRRGVDQFTKGKTPRERADGVKNMMVGMMDYVRRILNALDYGAIASLQNQNISKYAMAVMRRQKMNDKQANEMFGVMMKAKNDFYLEQIAIGTDKNKASILADEFYISSWKEALSKAGVEKSDIQKAMDAAINDALSSVGRNRQSLDAFREEATNLKDAGVSSMPALWLLESIANAANRSDNQVVKLFSRVIYGFAIVPARVIRETAWFSPYGFVRFGYDAIAKMMGKTSPYAQSLGTDIQYSQRLNEAIAGTVALFGLMALRAGSTDDPEDEDVFKIVFTGNGPQRKDDPQFYDSWYKAGNKPNSMIVSFGKTKFTLNMMRGFEAFTWPAMMLGALDDLEIRKKQKQQTKTPAQLEDAAIVAGFVFDAALRRGPYAFTTKSLFGTYGDIGVEGVAKGLTFPAKTLIPVLGTSLASNISNFLNDPIDRRTLDGAVWSNIPFIGPAVAPKSLNAFGEPSLSTDLASKMFKLGVPIVYDIPTDRESIKLHELVLKQGGGPSIPTRNQLAQRLDRQPTNKEYEMFVREYGAVLTTSMKKNYDKLFNAKPEFYSRAVERIGLRARDVAENKVRQAAKKP